MTQEKLSEILKDHKNWINNNDGNRANLIDADLRRANLSDADLRHANLSGANLIDADLSGADLSGADLSDADLRHANLSDADLRHANLSGADLSGANLIDADLSGANLINADLSGANLIDANLSGANLRRADLRRANLSGADLSDAYLRRANLSGADLSDAYLSGAGLPHFGIVPEEGSFIAWKKCQHHIVKLEIPEDAKRVSSITGRKCRASKAMVLEIFDKRGNKSNATEAYGKHKSSFKYTEGEMAFPDDFNDDIRIECSHGIHFFITKSEAIEW